MVAVQLAAMPLDSHFKPFELTVPKPARTQLRCRSTANVLFMESSEPELHSSAHKVAMASLTAPAQDKHRRGTVQPCAASVLRKRTCYFIWIGCVADPQGSDVSRSLGIRQLGQSKHFV